MNCISNNEASCRKTPSLKVCNAHKTVLLGMARKISPDRLEEHDGELGIWKIPATQTSKTQRGRGEPAAHDRGREFETILNFNFDILCRVTLGKGNGSGALYKIHIPGEESRLVCLYLDDCLS